MLPIYPTFIENTACAGRDLVIGEDDRKENQWMI